MSKFIYSAFADEYSPNVREQAQALRKHNINYVELRNCNGINIADLSMKQLKEVKSVFDDYGIGVSSVGSPIGKVKVDCGIKEYLNVCRDIFEKAVYLEAKFCRIFSFYPKGNGFTESEIASVYENLEQILKLAEKYNVVLCHENEANIYGESPQNCLNLLTRFDGLKAVFDMGNFVLDGYDPVDAYFLLQKHIAYFHIKDSLSVGAVVPAGKGEAHIAEIVKEHMRFAEKDFFVSVEPHLQTFDGLNALVGKSFDNPYKYPDCKTAFQDDIEKLRGILQ